MDNTKKNTETQQDTVPAQDHVASSSMAPVSAKIASVDGVTSVKAKMVGAFSAFPRGLRRRKT